MAQIPCANSKSPIRWGRNLIGFRLHACGTPSTALLARKKHLIG